MHPIAEAIPARLFDLSSPRGIWPQHGAVQAIAAALPLLGWPTQAAAQTFQEFPTYGLAAGLSASRRGRTARCGSPSSAATINTAGAVTEFNIQRRRICRQKSSFRMTHREETPDVQTV